MPIKGRVKSSRLSFIRKSRKVNVPAKLNGKMPSKCTGKLKALMMIMLRALDHVLWSSDIKAAAPLMKAKMVKKRMIVIPY